MLSSRRVPFSPNNSEHFLKLQLALKIRIFEEFTLYFHITVKNSLKNQIFPLGKVFAIFGTRLHQRVDKVFHSLLCRMISSALYHNFHPCLTNFRIPAGGGSGELSPKRVATESWRGKVEICHFIPVNFCQNAENQNSNGA